MHISQSVKLAMTVALLIVMYFLVRGVFGTNDAEETVQPSTAFTVLVDQFSPSSWNDEIVVQGRTKAQRKVIVRAETVGTVIETPAELGSYVEKGDTLCRLSEDARRAGVAEARAQLAQADLEFKAAEKLGSSGFRSETGVASARASRDRARAQLEQARLELQKTNIIAPFSGVFDQRLTEIGDFLSIGDPCGMVIQSDPFLVVGSVSEKDVGKISAGNRGVAELATGERIEGQVRFVSSSALPATRTFTVELEIPNPEGKLKDGVTAEFTIFAENQTAYNIPRDVLVLNAEGQIGARSVSKDGLVNFNEVSMLGENAQGIWVTGFDGPVTLIVRGQEYVQAGEQVSVTKAADRSAIQGSGQ